MGSAPGVRRGPYKGRAEYAATTASGLGASHVQERKQALARLQDGDPCAYCGQPMFRGQRLHLDHSVPRAVGGEGPRRLVHGRCNESAGAKLGNRLRRDRRRGVHPRQNWAFDPGSGTSSREW